jgi:hypothetical protein
MAQILVGFDSIATIANMKNTTILAARVGREWGCPFLTFIPQTALVAILDTYNFNSVIYLHNK